MKFPQRILVMGLPGSGKTYFSERLKAYIEERGQLDKINPNRLASQDGTPALNWNKVQVTWFNADEVRKKFNDWDFSKEGRIRQSVRMFEFAIKSSGEYVICDFVAPLPEMRANFKADWTIWIDTIDSGRFEDTNKAFVPPDQYDFRIPEQNAEEWVPHVGDHIINNVRRPVFDWKKDTVQMLGRWQPWHPGHRALFTRLLARTGQVCIMIRDTQGIDASNPFSVEQVKKAIRKDLDPLFQGLYEIVVVPNIVHIGYGRGVGYTIEEEKFDESITSISATNIRKQMGM